jgi:fatty acid desaturase
MNLHDYLSKEELSELLQRSDWRASWEVLFSWTVIILSFLMVGLYPNVLTIVFALILLGGRQVALAILMHDSSHRSLFRSKEANKLIGQWLCAYPIFHNAEEYRIYHLQHHSFTGSEKDPDLPIAKAYPTTGLGFVRKVFRDLSGQTGIKGYIGIFMMHLGYLKYSLGGLVIKIDQSKRRKSELLTQAYRNLTGPFRMNLLIFGVLFAFDAGWLYLLWIGALLTTHTFFLRIRALAEHGVTPSLEDPLNNTRTTKAHWWERLMWAPHNVNYHLEHHLMMTVPCYRLPKMHKLLMDKGFFQKACYADSYMKIFKAAIK